MNDCGCCAGVAPIVPLSTANRPGLGALSYRIGTYRSFFDSLKARLSSKDYPGLASLRTRDLNDPSIALLDAWACVADVLTFYQERVASEGFVRTATERLSILELGRTVGYELRPGVSATSYLAYTLEQSADITIPVGTRAQTVPKQGELPQSFETSDPLHARGDWSTLGPRTTKPQAIDLSAGVPTELYFTGSNNRLKPDDLLLIVDPNHGVTASAPDGLTALVRVQTVDPQAPNGPTHVTTETIWPKPTNASPPSAPPAHAAPNADGSQMQDLVALDAAALRSRYAPILKPLLTLPSQPPRDAAHLQQSVPNLFAVDQDAIPKTLSLLHPPLDATLYPALEQFTSAAKPALVYAFRVHAAPFGANAPLRFMGFQSQTKETEGPKPPQQPAGHALDPFHRFEQHLSVLAAELTERHVTLKNIPKYEEWALAGDEKPQAVSLDRQYPTLLTGGWVVIFNPDNPSGSPQIERITRIDNISRAQYGITGPTSVLTIADDWYAGESTIAFLRKTEIFAQSEALTLAEMPIEDAIAGGQVELDGLYDGLDPGRWLIVSGDRADVPGTHDAELVMLSASNHTLDPKLPGDKMHTTITLAQKMAYRYVRDKTTIYGDVVRATHGETRNEVLGSGSGSLELQQFTLKAAPLTFISAPTAAGAKSTLGVTANGVTWSECDDLNALGPVDRGFITRTDNAGKTTIVFGDGVHGERLPTGSENVKAVYRFGIGAPGNVDAGQITLLASRPLGVKAVVNPQPATGGADPEDLEQGRSNVPLATAALERIVSVDDYAAFARTFAGVAKAKAARFAGAPPLVHVTIAGVHDAPIEPGSDLVRNLVAALLAAGDPQQALDVQPRGLMALVLSARVALLPNYQWEVVSAAIRASLLDTFGFEQRGIAEIVYLSEVISAMQAVAGVAYVGVDGFDAVSDRAALQDLARLSLGAELNDRIVPGLAEIRPDGTVAPAQIAIFEPSLPEAIVLKETT